MSLLDALYRNGLLRPIDHALAQSLQRLDPDTPDMVLAAAALASLAVASGHAGFRPDAPARLVEAQVDWPATEAWLAALAASPWIDQPREDHQPARSRCPLVLEHGLLYLRRYREYEARLAGGLQRIASHPMSSEDTGAVGDVFAALFPGRGEGARRAEEAGLGEDRQARAAALALRRALLLVTGGPGTGKTTTIARLLVLRIAQALAARPSSVSAPTGHDASPTMAAAARTASPDDGPPPASPTAAGAQRPAQAPGASRVDQPPLRIALAAPTGRAAERMAESLRRAVQALVASGIDPALCAALPDTASTVHRLLGSIPDSPNFRHHADNPLPLDVLVVDEASMVDLPLMCKLVEAVASGTQLILLGDADQLPSVEAGDVLAAILGAAGPGHALREDDARALQPLLGSHIPVDADTRGLRGHRVQLLRGYRQDRDFDLAPLAEAARSGDADTALALLRGHQLRGVTFHEDVLDPFEVRREALLAHWRSLADAPDPATALVLAQRLRLLTAVRAGPQGARGLNARIEELLSGRRTGLAPAYFHGRLLLVTENSYRHRLFNGDIGICLADEHGALMAWFPGDIQGEVRAFHPAALPQHESAFAMTVHKAQGSEFEEVWLQLPRTPSRVLSRELVYTAITRARTRLHVAGSAQVLREALARHAVRMSGLEWRLGGGDERAGVHASGPDSAGPGIVQAPRQGALF